MMVKPKYQRVVLKLSGEALAGEDGFGIKPPVIKEIVQEIKEVHELGIEMASRGWRRKHLAWTNWCSNGHGTCPS